MISTNRLLIKPFEESDAEAFFELSNDKGFGLFPINDYRQKNVTSALEWIKKSREINLTRNLGKWGIWSKDSHELLGMGGLTPWTWEGVELIDLTYRFRESAWGKGFGMESAQGLVEHGFKNLELLEITATITPDNQASKKIAERLGMRFDKNIVLLGVSTDLYRVQGRSPSIIKKKQLSF